MWTAGWWTAWGLWWIVPVLFLLLCLGCLLMVIRCLSGGHGCTGMCGHLPRNQS
jgi:hypothetical protein